ncbi:MAG: bifunctional phosphopantothenoylcysteine decarboxylase/phosphopantothenate--cysteine ligase CoaBC [Euryarchaeota archaeon]|jgi:phosphopantothenoylcysteine decarboxylase/phosphopantothenate--cysteine ligase|nr:bifunctional phosphopantothenoylcysteine decarboxylase/phosphopantothenate--cysteine ligase CoaBC [Euryarchaeota archaeon]MBT4982400.1 bifunctional phosphopantothenoylcysteine decarboxylase/phosphopantothenate--cysteine ligase CoaBC [Euryarchaeota archaeon]
MRDTDVEVLGGSLKGQHVLLGVTGGIAAVDTVRLARELRRHGAEITVIMTPSAQKIITSLAVRWASQGEVITDWDGDLSALSNFDAILVTPATRNIMASFIHGLMNGPLLMSLSAARGRNAPIMMVPSMHNDLASDPVTEDLVMQCAKSGVKILWGAEEEGKRKNPNHEEIVARLAHFINQNSTSVVVTLGATRSAIDDVRYVQNTSSGRTGYQIADYLYRLGMDITCVSGVTTVDCPAWLPLEINCPDPDDMLAELKALAKDEINVWIHAAAVLDYVIPEPVEGKIASLQGELDIQLQEGAKHIMELKDLCKGSTRIGFKLESGIKQKDLVHRAVAQIQTSGMNATIANRIEDIGKKDMPRGWLVDTHGAHFILDTEKEMCIAIRSVIENNR